MPMDLVTALTSRCRGSDRRVGVGCEVESAEIVTVGHLVQVLDDQIRVCVRLSHWGQFFLQEVDGDGVVYSVGRPGWQVGSCVLQRHGRRLYLRSTDMFVSLSGVGPFESLGGFEESAFVGCSGEELGI